MLFRSGGDAAIQVPVPVSATSHGSHAETGRVGSAGANNVGVRGSSQSPPQGEAQLKNDSTEKPPEIVEDGKPIAPFITGDLVERETCNEAFLVLQENWRLLKQQVQLESASSRSLLSRPPLPAILESISRRKERLRATVVVLPSSCTAHHIQVSLIHAACDGRKRLI